MKALPAVVLIALNVSACSSLLPAPARENIVSGVRKYCVGMSAQERAVIRADINSMLDGVAAVQVDCLADH